MIAELPREKRLGFLVPQTQRLQAGGEVYPVVGVPFMPRQIVLLTKAMFA
jgi:hypothetical protein